MGEATRKLIGFSRVAKGKESERFDNGEKTLKKDVYNIFILIAWLWLLARLYHSSASKTAKSIELRKGL